ncbi:unnamed protein product, partial [Staurois parvus]
MISVHVSSRAVSVTARVERNADNRHFPIYMRSAVIGHSRSYDQADILG